MKYVIALDQGTTSSRAIAFDRTGAICAVAQAEFPQIFPRPGWVEHDPEAIWSSQAGALADVASELDVADGDIAAVGITNQRETTVVWDRASGRPVHNAIVWQDRRTAATCDRLREDGHEPLFQRKTGLILDPYFAGTKIRWILDNVEGAREAAEAGRLACGTVDSWLLWKLSGGRLHVTDASNASRTLGWNIHTQDWDDELLGLLNVPRAILPDVRDSGEVYGNVASEILPSAPPVAAMMGDQQSALFGQLCLEQGAGKNTYGTGCFMLMNVGAAPVASKNRLLTTVAWRRNGRTEYALEGSVFIGGAVVQWLRDGLKLIRRSSDVEALAREVDDNGGVYFVPAFAGLGAPHWDPYARGALLGMTRGTTDGHIARAALEAIAFQTDDVIRAMQADTGGTLSELRVDGGAAANDLLLQFQADLLGAPIVRPRVLETTALGAAYMAGLTVGFWDDVEQLRAMWRQDRRFEPQADQDSAREALRCWRRAVDRSRAWHEA